MDAFTDPEIEEIWNCKSTQVGGSEALFNMIGFCASQDPGPAIVVYPTETVAKSVSKTRIQPMIELSPVLRSKYLARESEDLELQFTDMQLFFAWSESAASLASHPCRYVFLDEIDKFVRVANDGADPISLAIERTNTFPYNRKIYGASTPTHRHGNIWKMRERANEIWHYFVPCPHCGHHQVLTLKQIKWPSGADADEAHDTAWYECEKCSGHINDGHLSHAVSAGEWRCTEKRGRGRRVIWTHIWALYSPWITIGKVARKFLSSKDDPAQLRNFINSWLAEPYEDTAQVSAGIVMDRQTELEAGIVPNEAMLLTAGVDLQLGQFYWTIRAWGPKLTSWNIAHGASLSWADVVMVMDRPWLKQNGEEMLVGLCCIDSGNDADEVYEFCIEHSEWAIPIKGASTALLGNFRISTINRADSRANGSRLVLVDGGKYKSLIHSRMNRPNDKPGSWMVYADCDQDYAEQVTSEHKVFVEKNGRQVEVWEKKTSHAANHYLDCEVYAACAADLMNVRYLSDEPIPDENSKPDESKVENKQASNWMPSKKWV